MTVYLVISLPKLPYVHRIYMALANPTHLQAAHCIIPLLPLYFYWRYPASLYWRRWSIYRRSYTPLASTRVNPLPWASKQALSHFPLPHFPHSPLSFLPCTASLFASCTLRYLFMDVSFNLDTLIGTILQCALRYPYCSFFSVHWPCQDGPVSCKQMCKRRCNIGRCINAIQ